MPGFFAFFMALIFSLVYVGDVFSGPGMRQPRHHHDMHHGMGHMGKGICPQTRTTAQAPDTFLKMKNPLEPTDDNIYAGEAFFQTDAQPTACKVCHGATGNGLGMMAPGLNPPPRNFACGETMQEISDGQMFWVITHGSVGTGMHPFKSLQEKHVWQIIHYLRTLSR
ncbi:cytochrome C [Candidatus Nitromaritima sp. SCGC AAA799-C22]|nr:cytochrome C [Candidatus Nitromaritima sp. SCGC AAA799-C22]